MITLTANTTLHCNCITGSDSSGNGSSGAPFKTPAGAMNYLKGVDLSGYFVVIQLDVPGTYSCSFTVAGLFRGQSGDPSQLTIQGDTSGNYNTADTYVLSGLPDSSGCITATFGSSFTLNGLKIDMYASQQGPNGVNGGGMALNIASKALVVCNNTVWGYQTNPFAYINAAQQGQLVMSGYVWCNAQANASVASFIGVGQSAYASCYLAFWLNSNIPEFSEGVVFCDEAGDTTWPDCTFLQYETTFTTTFTLAGTNTITIPDAVKTYILDGFKVLGVGFPGTGLSVVSGAGTTTLTLSGTPTTSSGAVMFGYPSQMTGPGFCISLGSLINTGTPTTIDVDTWGDIFYFPGDRFSTTLAANAAAGDMTIDVASIGTYPGAGIHNPNTGGALGFLFTQCIQGVGIAAGTRVANVNGTTITLTLPLLQNMASGTTVNVHGVCTDGSYYR